MTADHASFVNALRAFVYGQAPIPEKGRNKGIRRWIDHAPDDRFVAHFTLFNGDGNKQTARKAGAL